MPEGPEIRRAADRLAEAVVGDRLVSAWFAFPALKRFEKRLAGAVVESITPHGKALLTRFDNGWTLYSHNQLYGVWRIAEAGERPDTQRSLRVALETARKSILLYSASDVAMWRSDELHAHPFLARLGPDVLDPALDAAAVEARLRDRRFSWRALGALLLDQAFLAGMGNYLRSEVLFAAHLLPERRPRDLEAGERSALARELLAVPRHSYATRGIEHAGGMRADYLTDTPDAFRFLVFDREGQPCPACGTRIRRQQAGSRRLYLCPSCQR
ncbi:MAG: endonuclease VIII [Luteimonas sp.]|nr:endonuclease VIII [Luteimonas sp.]